MQFWSNDLIDRLCTKGIDWGEQSEEYSKIFGIRRIASQILTDRQLRVFNLRFGRGFTMIRVGEIMNISPVAVLRLERRLISRLQGDLFYLEDICLKNL